MRFNINPDDVWRTRNFSEAFRNNGQMMNFGKDEKRLRSPHLGLGLLDLDPRC